MTKYIIRKSFLDEFYHSGVKGQKWGIRRYQNEDGTLTAEGKEHYRTHDYTFEKGFRFNTSASGLHPFLNIYEPKINYVYDAENKNDADIYKGPLLFGKVMQGARYCATKEYEAVNDLKAPSDQKAIDLFIETYKDNPAKMAKSLNALKKNLDANEKTYAKVGMTLSDEMQRVQAGPKKYTKKMSEEDLRNTGFSLFMNNSGLAQRKEVARAVGAFYDKVKSKGYNALIDYNNREVYNGAQMPLIVFNSIKDLKLKNMKLLSTDEVMSSLTKVDDRMKAAGRKVAL